MIMENTAEDIEAHKAKQAATDHDVAVANGKTKFEEADADERDERIRREEAERLKEVERAKAMQTSLGAGPMKIRTDYVPKSKHFVMRFLIDDMKTLLQSVQKALV